MRIAVPGAGEVGALLELPENPRWMLVLAHGAGAGMSHPFLASLAREFAALDVATLRYQFPYMEEKRRVPDSPEILTASVAAAVRAAAEAAPGLPILAGGKSMGGRMTSQAAARGLLDGVSGLVFFGFPLHPPKRPSTKRAEHLSDVRVPMLFWQGARDEFAELSLLRPIVEKLGRLADLEIIEGADHSFHVLKSSGRTDQEVLRDLVKRTIAWQTKIIS
jgi:uncharacterized protein